ncbi:MAG: hypothetical protein Q8P41_17880, partial [Pseudomonadota bacterium]|nr:hypothetical protein [Pseudomonadota bacterium]
APVPPPVALPLPAEVVVAAPAPEPIPEPVPAEPPLPEPTLTDADREALAAMERDEVTDGAPIDDDDGEAFEASAPGKRQAARTMRRARARTERNPRRPPCPESSQSIARVAEAAWYIDRDLIEYYATHMTELQKLGTVWAHKNKEGKPDGFRVALARCSVLRQGGLKSGDIVHDINGRRISSVLQAIGAYIALRAEPELFVNVTRKGEPVTLAFTIEQPERGRAARRAARKAAGSQAAR